MDEFAGELAAIKERNARVEADKAWETSTFRRALITAATYLVACLALYTIGVPDFYLGAIIPALGFYLSTLSLPSIKQWWIKNRLNQGGMERGKP